MDKIGSNFVIIVKKLELIYAPTVTSRNLHHATFYFLDYCKNVSDMDKSYPNIIIYMSFK